MTPAELVRAYARPNKKRLGQHFLTQVGLLDRMVACIGDAVEVIEVGPGPGTLTTRLLAAGKRVRAVEIDRDAIAFLQEAFADNAAFDVIEADATKTILPQLLSEGPRVLVGNLPYNVGNEILFRAMEADDAPDRMVLMFQKEVAERIVCTGRSSQFSLLSVGVGNRYRARIAFLVSAGAFVPPPKVASAVVVLDRLPAPLASGETARWLRRLSAAAFGQRRKMMRSSLRSVVAKPEPLLLAAGISPTSRPEELEVADLVRLAVLAEASGLSAVVGEPVPEADE